MPERKHPDKSRIIKNKLELREAAKEIDWEGDIDHVEARRNLIKQAEALGISEDLPLGWEQDGTLVSGWDTNRKSGEAKHRPVEEPNE
jgi:hypothetical protein